MITLSSLCYADFIHIYQWPFTKEEIAQAELSSQHSLLTIT